MTRYLNWPCLMLNAVIHSWLSFIHIWLNAAIISNFVKQTAFANLLRVLLISGIE